MRAPTAAAQYVPSWRRDGRPVPGPDEDPLTMLAGAIEPLLARTPGAPVAALVVLGSVPASQDWAIAALLGAPPGPWIHRAVPEAREAIAFAARSEEPGPSFVVAVDAVEDGPPGGGSEPARAVAVRLDPSDASEEFGAGSAGSARAEDLLRALPPTIRDRLPPPGPTVQLDDPARTGRFRSAPLDGVSQGAHVPRPRYLENLGSRWRLEGDRCPTCHALTFPARGTCRNCGRTEGLVTERLPPDGGRVVARTTIGPGGQPTEFDAQVEALGPYDVVLAELAPGARLALQVADAPPGRLRVGDRIGTRLRRLYAIEGEWRYGRKAVPLDR